MILNADDFLCMPDGRFLERVSIETDSAVLNDADGVLRDSDVGKSIAIPGAADLETRIARLINHREVRHAKIDQDSNRLTGTLFDPAKPAGDDEEPFVKRHEGFRITIAGAGPSGGLLIADIATFIDATTVDLSMKASASVMDVEVILNEGGRVRLEDYARRSVSAVMVDLEDRMISDAEMIIGGAALVSATARFSSADLDKKVKIKEAGLLVTTIQSFQNSTQVTLAATAKRKVEGGQADVWNPDSKTREKFEELLASLASLDVQSAEIQFSPGVYDFERKPYQEQAIAATMSLHNVKNLTIRGAGTGVTILRLMPQQDLGQGVTHFLETQDCMNLHLRDFSVHGAYLTQAKTAEQTHAITLNEGSENITIEGVRVFQSPGDGIRFLGRKANLDTGKPANKVRNIRLEGCELIQNKRSGLAFQRAVELVWVKSCYIEMLPPSTDSCIDLEPSGLAPTDLIFDSNVMKHGTPAPAVSLSGSVTKEGVEPARRIRFSNNEINGGNIFCTDVAELSIQNNTVRVTALGRAQRIPVAVAPGGDSVIISGNILVNDDPATRAVISLEGTREVRRALVTNNICYARAGNGIQCLSSDDLIVQGNLIVATGTCNAGINVRSESSAVSNLSLRDNQITVQDGGTWDDGIDLLAEEEKPIQNLSIIGNSINGARRGIVLEGAPYTPAPLCALNLIDVDVKRPLLGLTQGTLNHLLAGGVTSQTGGRCFVGLGNPNGRVSGKVGDIFQSLDGTKGNTLWVKEKDNDTTDHWNPK